MYTPAGSESFDNTKTVVVIGSVVTGSLNFASGQKIAAYTPVGIKSADNKAYPHNPTASDGTQNIVSFTVHAVDTTGGDAANAVYNGGEFNIDAINWHASLDSTDKRKAAVAGTPLNVDVLAES